MRRGPSVDLTPIEIRVLELVVTGETQELEVDEVTRRLELKRAYVVRAMFALRRKGYLKREGWIMRAAVPLGLIEQAVEGGACAARRC